MVNFPFEVQQAQNDCGPTSLWMIAKYYGINCSYQEICKRCRITENGVSLMNLCNCAESLGFHTLATKCTVSDMINHIPIPTILYWKERHYSVVYYVDDELILIADPMTGNMQYPIAEFSSKWYDESTGNGILLALEPNESGNSTNISI
mgnify:CR=1 FL=1